MRNESVARRADANLRTRCRRSIPQAKEGTFIRMAAPTIEPSTNIRELVAALPIAQDVLTAFGLHCSGCGVNKYETLAAGAKAHGLRVEPIVAALTQARLAGRVPTIMNEDKRPHVGAPGAFRKRGNIASVVAIMSGKGGVGKSLVTALLAVGLRRANKRVGILDADITGPSIPRIFGLHNPLGMEKDDTAAGGAPARPLFVPATTRAAIEVVSSNLLTPDEETAMIWRGPIVSGVIRQFYEQTLWSDLDILLLDLPPGTSDAPLTVLQSLSIDGVVLVTMPQALATMIVRKAANLVHQMKKPILGVVENMSYFVAPDTGARYDLFGPSYADRVAELARAPVLARMPIDPALVALADAGRIEEADMPVVDSLTAGLLAALAAQPKAATDDLADLMLRRFLVGAGAGLTSDMRPCARGKPWAELRDPPPQQPPDAARYGKLRRAFMLAGIVRSLASLGAAAYGLGPSLEPREGRRRTASPPDRRRERGAARLDARRTTRRFRRRFCARAPVRAIQADRARLDGRPRESVERVAGLQAYR